MLLFLSVVLFYGCYWGISVHFSCCELDNCRSVNQFLIVNDTIRIIVLLHECRSFWIWSLQLSNFPNHMSRTLVVVSCYKSSLHISNIWVFCLVEMLHHRFSYPVSNTKNLQTAKKVSRICSSQETSRSRACTLLCTGSFRPFGYLADCYNK